jgi:hypothetical protein
VHLQLKAKILQNLTPCTIYLYIGNLMKTITSIVFLLILSCSSGYSQVDFKRNTIYGELLGAGGLASLNFDYRLGKNPAGFGIRAGVGFFQWNNSASLSFPLMGNYLIGKNGNYFELGLGTSIGYEYILDSSSQIQHTSEEGFRLRAPIFNLGYRRQVLAGGLNFRIGLSPQVSFYHFGGAAINWFPNLSLGHTF